LESFQPGAHKTVELQLLAYFNNNRLLSRAIYFLGLGSSKQILVQNFGFDPEKSITALISGIVAGTANRSKSLTFSLLAHVTHRSRCYNYYTAYMVS